MRYKFHTADVFTTRVFGGNPLAVFPDARGLDGGSMQRITREFNLSETVFVLPPDDAANTRRLRIFTPGGELAFAGHPTVGTAFVLAHVGALPLAGDELQIIFEDPATGSAAAALAGYLAPRAGRSDGTLRWVLEQGFEMGRPSIIELAADMAGGALQAVRVAGAAVMVSEGWFELPEAE